MNIQWTPEDGKLAAFTTILTENPSLVLSEGLAWLKNAVRWFSWKIHKDAIILQRRHVLLELVRAPNVG